MGPNWLVVGLPPCWLLVGGRATKGLVGPNWLLGLVPCWLLGRTTDGLVGPN